ncbi:hypothetical protein [Pseudomonas anguilliseptica]|uniref:Uncharacterized protein n=1 Tax=Pseudomonas anguilliseptica TaxID=53406 RepID=A0A1H4V2G1_PSEAG|nr:hypothetical protein [Pseudomonas anguilliseptica]SEC74711.1 hypothetical protein SAMN05421553_1375 [Pseudomonas anguilliseptica]
MHKFFYCPETGQVHALEADGSQDYIIQSSWQPKTPAEAEALCAERLKPVASVRRAELLAELAAIDAASARPLRAILVGSATEEDRARLTELDEQAAALRRELATLEPPPAA